MAVNLSVVGSFMEYWVGWNSNGTCIVSIKSYHIRLRNTEFCKKSSQTISLVTDDIDRYLASVNDLETGLFLVLP